MDFDSELHGDDGDGTQEGGASSPPRDQPLAPDNDDDDEEEDEEEEDEEDGVQSRPKKKRRKHAGNRFIDIEAEVDEDDEEDEEDDEMGAGEGFLAEEGGPDEEIVETNLYHQTLDRNRASLADKDAAQIAREIEERDRQRRMQARNADEMGSGNLPQHALMPEVNDPTIWAIKVRPGRERDIILAISNKAASAKLNIISAFYRESLKGYVYVEARQESSVAETLHGLIGVYLGTAPLLIPLEERSSLLTTRQKEAKLDVGGWVRFKRGKYAGDIAQIIEIPENTGLLMLKYIPRIDLNPPEPEPEAKEDNGKKRKKRTAQSAYRPPARLFNADDIKNAFGQKQVSYRNGIFGFQGEEFRDGFCEKEHRMPTLQLEDVNPTIDEITRFTGDKPAGRRRDEDDDEDDEGRRADADSAMNLNLIAAATKQAAKAALQPGDHVEIYRGGQKGLIGTIKAITGDILAIVPESADLGTDPVEIEADYVRKRFKVGDNVRVMSGVQAGERGLVVAIEDAEVTLMSSLTGQEVKVFSKDLRDAAEQDAAVVTRSVYDLHDLVQIDPQTSGVVFDIENDTFHILDQARTVRKLKATQISGKVPQHMQQVATDKDGSMISRGDSMRESGNSVNPREGKVLHSLRSLFTWLYNRAYPENKGVFVVYSQSLVSETVRAAAKMPSDSTKMNPAFMPPPPMPFSNASNAPGGGRFAVRDKLVGQRVMIGGRGLDKGKEGTVKDVNGNLYRVELSSTNKFVNVAKAQLFVYERGDTTQKPSPADEWLEKIGQGRPRASADGGSERSSSVPVPSYGNYNSTAKTPNPYASANPYKSSAPSPNPWAAGAGGRTSITAAGQGTSWGGASTPLGNATPRATTSTDPWSASAKTPHSASAGQTASSSAWSSTSKTPRHPGVSADTKPASSKSPWEANSKTPHSSEGYGSTGTRSAGYYQDTPAANAPTVRAASTPYAAGTPSNYAGAPTPRFAETAATPGDAPTPAARGAFINPERLQMQQRSGGGLDTVHTPAPYESFDSSRGRGRGAQETGANTAPLANNRWGQAAASAATPGQLYANPPTPAAAPQNAPTPGTRAYERPTPNYNASQTPGVYASQTPGVYAHQTPGAYSHQTPSTYGTPSLYADAQTPGAGFGQGAAPSEKASIPYDWHAVGLEVTIGPDDRGISCYGGRYDGQQGVITGVRSVRDECDVQLDHGEVQIPSMHLLPVQPTMPNTACSVISTGKYRRLQVEVTMKDGFEWLCKFADGRADTVDARFLCVYDRAVANA